MDDFEYLAPSTLEETVRILAESNGRTKLLAGGTDLLVQLREGLRHADLVVDVKRIPELTRIEHGPDGLTIGAAVPCYRIYEDAEVSRSYPGVVDAARIIGGWQIQSRASLGGNICNASPAADTVPILIAYAAKLNIAGPNGMRTVPVESFFRGPGRALIEGNELLVSITLPAQPTGAGAHYQRFIPRNEMDIAVVGVGSWLELNSTATNIVAARIGLGAVAPTPLFAEEASNWLLGKPANSPSFETAGELAKKIARPISDMRGPADYRTHLVGVLTKRTLEGAFVRARGLGGNGRKP